MIDKINFSDQPVKYDVRTYGNIKNIAAIYYYCIPFTRLSIFQKILQTSCNRFNYTIRK